MPIASICETHGNGSDGHYCSTSQPPCTTHSWTTLPLSLMSERRRVRTSSAVITLPPPLFAPSNARPMMAHSRERRMRFWRSTRCKTGFELREGDCVHERKYCKRPINKMFVRALAVWSPVKNGSAVMTARTRSLIFFRSAREAQLRICNAMVIFYLSSCRNFRIRGV